LTAVFSILIAEDEPAVRAMVRTVLESAGFVVEGAKDGAEAAALLAGHRFDLLLTDILMPVSDGLELIISTRRIRPDLPIIAMSGGGPFAADHYLLVARSMGVKALLAKPFTRAELLSAIEGAIGVPS
jgi:CheY-like chemotaxis protein